MTDREGYAYIPIYRAARGGYTSDLALARARRPVVLYLVSPARQAKKRLALSGRQYVKRRKSLRRKAKAVTA